MGTDIVGGAPADLPRLGVSSVTWFTGEAASATLSPDGKYRYALTRQWGPTPPALWIMLNPSTADAFTDDATIRRVIGFSRQWDCGGAVVVNLFGLRSTDPRVLRDADDPVGPDNDAVAAWYLSGQAGPIRLVVAAWGAHGHLHGRDVAMQRLIAVHGLYPHCLGRTRSGQPRHPLRLHADTLPVVLPGTRRARTGGGS